MIFNWKTNEKMSKIAQGFCTFLLQVVDNPSTFSGTGYWLLWHCPVTILPVNHLRHPVYSGIFGQLFQVSCTGMFK